MKWQAYLNMALLFGGALLAIALISPLNPLSKGILPLNEGRNLLPQGWAFFTKDPQSEYFRVYTRDSLGVWREFGRHFPNSAPANFFGLRRTNRVVTTEVALHVKQLEGTLSWIQCQEGSAITDCIARYDTLIYRVQNLIDRPFLPPLFAVVNQKPIPWSWRNTEALPAQSFVIIQTYP